MGVGVQGASGKSDLEADVVVVGGGVAGHVAALAAVETGSDVILCEKQERTGGSSVLSGGFFAFAGTQLQQQKRVDDTPELFYGDLVKSGGGFAREPLLRAYADGQLEFYRWLERHGVTFAVLEHHSGQSVPRSHRTDMPAMVARLAELGHDSGRVKYRRGTQVRSIERTGAGGAVSGLVAEAGGHTLRLRARKGIVLCTGGFSRSREMLSIFAPDVAKALLHGGEGSTGDGLKMAWKLGAGFRDMGFIKSTFGTHVDTPSERHELLLAFYMGAIVVNTEGRRFADESISYKSLGDACLKQPGGRGFQVFDQGIMNKSQKGVPLHDLQEPLARGLLIQADSLEELADRCGINGEVLRATVAKYNADVEAGRDSQFGRDGLCNHVGMMIPIKQPPFYAYPSVCFVTTTYCGLAVNERAEVLDVDGDVLPGLYAAGEVTGGFHGADYLTGTALGKAAFFGRVAGREAAARSAPAS